MTSVKINPRLQAQKAQCFSNWNYDDIGTARTNLEATGFSCIESIFSSQLLSELRSEASRKKTDAVPGSGTSQCQYRAHLSGLGKAGFSFLAGGRMLKLLDALFGIPFTLEESASCYTYYQPGDFLGPHLDHAEQCFVTVILYLSVIYPEKKPDKTGLELHILRAPPSDEEQPRLVIPTKAGSLIIGLGAENWHERPTLQDGEFITAITACYSRLLAA